MRIRNLVIYVMFSFVICMSACNNVSEENVSAETSMEVNQSESVESEENELADDVVAAEQEEVEISVSFKEKVFSDAYSYEEKDEFAFEYMSACAKEMSPSIHLLPFDEVGEYERSEAEPLSEIDIPEYVTVIALYKGDIGLDGVEEIALVMEIYVQGEDESDFFDADGQRMLILYREKEDGTYEYWKENHCVVEGKYNGGVLGDAFSGIEIKDGVLCIYSYGGSSDRWSYNDYYNMRNGELVLVNYEIIFSSTHHLNAQRTIYNFDEGTVVTYAESFQENFIPLKIYENVFEPVYFSFDSEKSEYSMVSNVELEDRGDLVDNDYMDYFGECGNNPSYFEEPLELSAAEALDLVKETYYPEMFKVEMSYEQEIYDNLSFCVGYEVPTYYYCDENGGRLEYVRLFPHSREHYVVYSNSKLGEGGRYNVYDTTSEIKKRD